MLALPFWEGHVVESCSEQADGSLLIRLSGSPEVPARCGRCRASCVLVHERRRRRVRERPALARNLESRQDPFADLPMSTERRYLEGQVVLVGYGRVGRRVAGALDERQVPYVVVEQNREQVEALRNQGTPAVSGNGADPAVLIQAHIAQAAMLVIATPDPVNLRQMADTARTLNPAIEVVLRTHSETESKLLRKDRVGAVFFGEEELAKGMIRHVLDRFASPRGQGQRE